MDLLDYIGILTEIEKDLNGAICALEKAPLLTIERIDLESARSHVRRALNSFKKLKGDWELVLDAWDKVVSKHCILNHK